MRRPDDKVFKAAYDAVEKRIEERYGVPVMISDVLDPNTGDLDGATIKVDYDLDLEMAFFVLIHLFGHTVQWNVSDEFRALGMKPPEDVTEDDMGRIADYERQATRYSLQLMHEAGVTGLDQWVSNWWAADWRFLERFYRTGETGDFKELLGEEDAELLTPLPVPDFTPRRWTSRWSF